MAEQLVQIALGTPVDAPLRPEWCRRCHGEQPHPTPQQCGQWPAQTAAAATKAAETAGTLPAGSHQRVIWTHEAWFPHYGVPAPPAAAQRGVGGHLQHLIRTRFGWPSCDACHALAAELDALGPAGCRRDMARIAAALVANAQLVLAAQPDWRAAILKRFPRAFQRHWATRLIREAIALAEAAPPHPFPESVTIGVTAFQRPQHLQACLRSIARFAPRARVIVADNGNQPVDPAACGLDAGRVQYLTLPFDCGLSAARNALVAHLQTEYLLLLEDDGELTAATDVPALVDVLASSPEIGVVGFHCRNGDGSLWCQPREMRGIHVRTRGDLAVHLTPAGTPYTLAEFVYNFALFRRAMLLDHPWADRLKCGEHGEYYLRVKHADAAHRWLVAHTTRGEVQHNTSLPESAEYQAHRSQSKQFHATAAREWRGRAQPSRLMPAQSRGILIVGAGYSGTSAIAEVLDRLGVPMAVRFVAADVHHPRGFCEDAWALDVFRRQDWPGLRRLLAHRRATAAVWGLKQPRLADHWPEVKLLPWPADTRIVVCDRDRSALIASHQAKRGVTDAAAAAVVDRRLAGVQSLLTDAAARQWPALRLDFDAVLRAPDQAVRQLAEFAGVPYHASAVAAIDPTLPHHRAA